MKVADRGRPGLWYALAIVVTLMGLASCWSPAQSIAPLYTEKDLVLDDTIVGIWHSKDEAPETGLDEWAPGPASYTIEKSGDAKDRGYIVRRGDGDTSELHLVRLGKYLFVDVGVWWDSAESKSVPFSPDLPPIYPYSFFPVHEFGRITVSPRVLLVRMLEREKVSWLEREHEATLEQVGPPFLIVSPTERLQGFMLERAEDQTVLPLNYVLCRKGADCALDVPLEKVADNPRDIAAGYDLARVYMRRDRFDDAWATWKRTPPPKSAKPPVDSGATLHALLLAESFIDWGHPSEGLEVLKAGTANNPKDPYARMMLGLGYLHLDRPQDAMAAFRKITPMMFLIKQRTDAADIAHFLYALAYTQMGEFEKARAEDRKGNGVIKSGLQAWSHFAQGDYAAAYAKLIAIRSYAEDHEPLLWYLILRHLDKSEAALEFLKRVEAQNIYSQPILEIFESKTVAIRELEKYFRGQISDAEFIAQIHPPKGRVIVPELCVAYFIVAEKHLLDGDRDQAREYFEKAVDTHAYTYGEWIAANARLKQPAQPAFTAAPIPSSSTAATRP